MEDENWKQSSKGKKPSYKPNSLNQSRGGYNGKFNKRYQEIPDFNSDQEKVKFLELQKNIPHLVMPGSIRRLAQRMNIDRLAEKMLSDEYIELQKSGWVFVKVIKPDDTEALPEDNEEYKYDMMSLDNGWEDYVLFKKKQ
jgi:hypothetical protein